MKAWQKWLVGILSSLTIITGIGVAYKMNQEKQLREEMIKIVESEEAKKLFEEELRYLDPQALTGQGKIHSYEVDYDSFNKNPLNGFSVTLVINGDKQIYTRLHLGVYDFDGALEIGSVQRSSKFMDLIEE